MTLIWNLLMGVEWDDTQAPLTPWYWTNVSNSGCWIEHIAVIVEDPQRGDERQLGAIACPPQLLITPPASHALHLLHYESDHLCVWKPGQRQLDQLQIRYTYVRTEGPAYKEHFGAKEHSYSHWLSLDLPAGWWDLARLLFTHPNAASSGMPRPCDYSRRSVFVWNRPWRRSLKKPCSREGDGH